MSRNKMKLVDSLITMAFLGDFAAVIFLLADTGIKFITLIAPLFVWAIVNTVEDVWVAVKVVSVGRKLTFTKGFNFALDALALALLFAGSTLWPTMNNSPIMWWIIWTLAFVFLFDGIITLVEYKLMD